MFLRIKKYAIILSPEVEIAILLLKDEKKRYGTED